MKRPVLISLLFALMVSSASAQFSLITGDAGTCDTCVCDSCPTYQDYKLVPRTIYEHKPITTRRLQTETVYDERQVVRYRPVVETTTRERKYTVNKPVQQTSMREERKTVLRPVWEYRTRDASYDRVNYVTETSTREERRTVMKPVVETSTREERRTVMRPVTQTVLQDQVSTAYRPVTSYQQRVIDQGGYVDQTQLVPGETTNRLRWQKAKCVPNPLTGECDVQRAGLYWTPQQGPPKQTVNRLYVPNPVLQQLAQTRMVPEQVTKKIPVDVTTMRSELQVRKVPVQTTKMVAEEQVRYVPVSVKKPVVERVPHQVEERRQRWVPQEMVRQVPVTTYKIVQEERVEQIPVQTHKTVAEYHTIQVPRQQSKWVEETTIKMVPRQIMYKIPVGSELASPVSESVSASSPASPAEYNVNVISDTVVPESTASEVGAEPTPAAGTPPTLEFKDQDARAASDTKVATEKLQWRSVRPFELTRTPREKQNK